MPQGALSSLLESNGDQIVGATGALRLLPEIDAEVAPDLVVLELGRCEELQELRVLAVGGVVTAISLMPDAF